MSILLGPPSFLTGCMCEDCLPPRTDFDAATCARIARITNAAADLLGEVGERWTQGQYAAPNRIGGRLVRQFCMIGAVLEVTTRCGSSYDEVSAVKAWLSRTITARHGVRTGSLEAWNDTHGRTAREVIEVLRGAAADAADAARSPEAREEARQITERLVADREAARRRERERAAERDLALFAAFLAPPPKPEAPMSKPKLLALVGV